MVVVFPCLQVSITVSDYLYIKRVLTASIWAMIPMFLVRLRSVGHSSKGTCGPLLRAEEKAFCVRLICRLRDGTNPLGIRGVLVIVKGRIITEIGGVSVKLGLNELCLRERRKVDFVGISTVLPYYNITSNCTHFERG